MNIIKDVRARAILDSRGMPTVEAEILLKDDRFGRFSCPSGASKGKKEALELRDPDGTNVNQALENIVEIIKPQILGKKFESQKEFDALLLEIDGTSNKSKLGANAILPVSAAFCKACLGSEHSDLAGYVHSLGTIKHFPVPLINILNGGQHANNKLCIQEFMIVPYGASSFRECLFQGQKIFQSLKKILLKNGFSIAVGDEGGFAPNLNKNEHALEFLSKAIDKAGFSLGENIGIALDVAADSFFSEEKNQYFFDGEWQSTDDLLSSFEFLAKKYHICSIEDPFSENDELGFKKILQKIGDKVQIVGDDLFVTQKEPLRRGVENELANSILIKMNQVGSVWETLETVDMAKKHNFSTIASHRSGDTEETFLADFALIAKTEQIKTGSLSRGERTAKYNRLLRLEEAFNFKVPFLGKNAFKGRV